MQNLFHIFKLNTHHHYRHIDSLSADAEQAFYHYFHHLLPSRKAPVFLCIGTPLLSADRFGPYIGSQLKKQDIPNVFGTLEHPVHAENIEFYRNYIQKYYPNNPVVAIDASVGTPKQMGCITLRKGALRPGRAVGKNICPIGHVEITGIFDNLHDTSAEIFCLFMGHIITQGIAQNFKA